MSPQSFWPSQRNAWRREDRFIIITIIIIIIIIRKVMVMFPKTDYLLHCDRNENTISVKDKKKDL